MGEKIENLEAQPYIFYLISSASLLIAKDIRKEFITLTNNVSSKIRQIGNAGRSSFKIYNVNPPNWKSLKGEVVCFIDGGVGQSEIFSKIPLIIRSGIFKVITGEKDIDKREKFEIYPTLVGDLENVKKDSSDYISVTRIIVELLSALKVIEDAEYQDTDILILHGPICYRLSQYSAHYIGEDDIERIINYASTEPKNKAREVINDFKKNCNKCLIKTSWCDEFSKNKIIRAVCLIKFILKKIFDKSEKNSFKPLIYGVVERSKLTEYTRKIIMPQLILNDPNFLNNYKLSPSKYPEKDIERLLKKTNYHDALLLSIILREGEYTAPFLAEERYKGFKSDLEGMGLNLLSDLPFKYSYLKVKQNTIPIRIEFPAFYTDNEIKEIIDRAFIYSKLLPNYAFPIGLDIVDKFAKVPQWMTEAFRKLILVKLGEEASSDSITMFNRLMSLTLLQKRNWQTRPKS